MRSLPNSGVTLIELMIVVVIIGILAAIAYPSYQRYSTQARRADGQIALTKLANDMEKFYSDCSRYPNSLTDARNCTGAVPTYGLGRSNNLSLDEHYSLAIALNASSTTYTLTATPRGTQATNDTDCTTLTLNYLGTKGATGANTANCWKR